MIANFIAAMNWQGIARKTIQKMTLFHYSRVLGWQSSHKYYFEFKWKSAEDKKANFKKIFKITLAQMKSCHFQRRDKKQELLHFFLSCINLVILQSMMMSENQLIWT